jgi:hypothetical protein
MTGNDAPAPVVRKPHRRTGKPPGGRPGNTNALRHGFDSAATLARRKAVNDILRAARKALREAN